MRGISTRQYEEVLPEMASTCGVSKSNVSREAAEAGDEALHGVDLRMPHCNLGLNLHR